MQIIGTRATSAFRVSTTYFRDHPTFAVGIDPTTGGPVRVVQSYTDDPAPAQAGHRWEVETDPQSSQSVSYTHLTLPTIYSV